MTKQQVLKEYLEFKRLSIKSSEKIKDIERDMNRFFNSSEKPIKDFKEQELINYLNSLDVKIRTLNGIKAYLKNFIKWKYEDYSIRFRNLDNICKSEKPLRAYEPEQMLTKKDIEKLVKGETNLVYKVYWLMFFYS